MSPGSLFLEPTNNLPSASPKKKLQAVPCSYKSSRPKACSRSWRKNYKKNCNVELFRVTVIDMTVLNLVFSLLAGILTTLSPCVLPVLPFVTGSSMTKSRWGPVALALGLLVAFVGATLLITISGGLFGIDPETLQKVAGVLLALSGLIFLWPRLSEWLTQKMSSVTRFANQAPNAEATNFVLLQQFVSGLLLGVIWSPCSGPSLGVAIGLATQAGGIGPAFILLLVFGLGAIGPLLLFAYGAKRISQRLKTRAGAITWIKRGLGLLIILFGILIYTGWDKRVEAAITDLLPNSWIQLTTQF